MHITVLCSSFIYNSNESTLFVINKERYYFAKKDWKEQRNYIYA